jgi:ATP-dependent Clp protease protease subunit
MPYPNEHAARVRDPGDFDDDSIRRKNITDGVDLISGKLKTANGPDDPMVEQAYRFDAEKFTAKQARKWCKDHDIDYISFEPATNSKDMGKTATFKIYGDIGEPMMDLIFFGAEDTTTVNANAIAEFIDANQDADEFVIRINSRGGDVQEGWAIYDLLTTSGKKITTIGEGKIYSIATVVFLAGSTRKMMKNADGLIHNPFIPPYTLADQYESGDLAAIAESLKQEEQKILDLYIEKTGQTAEKLAEYMKDETQLSADDMLSLGFATEIVEPVKAFAYIKLKTIKNMTTENDKKTFMDRFDAAVKAFSRLTGNADPKNMEFTDTSGNKFKIEKETGEPAVGDVAAPDGTFVMENGNTIVITGGKIESITPAKQANPELDAANAKIAELTAELNTLKGAKATADQAIVDFKAKETEITNLVTELREIKNKWKPEARSNTQGVKIVEGVDTARAREILDKHKAKTN